MMRTPGDLVARLEANPDVVGIARYGGRHPSDGSLGGDLDLYAFLERRDPGVESLHFHVGEIPVDLGLRTLEDLRRDEPEPDFDRVLVGAEVLYDPSGQLDRELDAARRRWGRAPGSLSENGIAFQRFSQQHLLDKVRHRTESDPLLCELLMGTNVYWLLQNYFHVRGLPYPGEKGALAWVGEKEPRMHDAIRRFYACRDLGGKLAISERLTELVLDPIGGAWRKGEVLALGADDGVDGLQVRGQRVFSALFGA